ncbi:MAG: T9SS type A sorting domain-containing protein, partial [Bacteroidota bacterium]|nr:T9SS type A sorting domain-containing protein [Bacteroidota bacterium]
MKKIILLFWLLFVIVTLYAQDYRISFAGSGESSNVGTVTVENLMQGKSLKLNGTEVLHLVASTTGINPVSYNESESRIYPNPTNGKSTINFVTTASGKVNIELFDITGKRIGASQNIITNGTHSYQVSNLRSGIYTLRISSQLYIYTGKLVSNGNSNSEMKINYLGNGLIPGTTMKLKSANAEKEMQYNIGDRLKITGTSGKYITVITDVPTQSKSITF